MTSDTQTGFTIIESMLFLAISALVFVVGFAGIGSRLEQVRYSDSVRNLESDVETAFRNTDDGLNLRPSGLSCDVSGSSPVITTSSDTVAGQQERCAVSGVDIVFDTLNVKNFATNPVAVVTGANTNGAFEFFSARDINEGNVNIDDIIKNAKPITAVSENYDLLWGLQYDGYLDNSGNISSSNVSVRYARSPISAQTFVYTDRGSGYSELTSPIDICFRDANDRSATLTVQPNATISVAYQGGACDV